ncbi:MULTISPECIES: hypothetical protein [Sphingobacterium]|uniref:DUF5668 domain-containing protein n=3 Tax=Sphingobacterium TaxID=28453 RepID=A0A420BES8_SPHD1|nr:hypothetical protein [Sphingobacterium detergens]RKE55198.1 hypothetical protein DFQ12_0027 [Sphingobacterium detergens]
MKKALGIMLILIGFALVVILKIGISKETAWMFEYGNWPLIILALALLVPGLILYNKNR